MVRGILVVRGVPMVRGVPVARGVPYGEGCWASDESVGCLLAPVSRSCH